MALRDYILNNFWWKLLSLLLAGLTWLTIQTAFQKDQNLRETPVVTSSTRTFPAIPVTLLTSTLSLNTFKVDPALVSVDVSGSAADLAKLVERQIHVYVDVSSAGDEKLFRRPLQAQVPGDLRVDKLSVTIATVERIPLAK